MILIKKKEKTKIEKNVPHLPQKTVALPILYQAKKNPPSLPPYTSNIYAAAA